MGGLPVVAKTRSMGPQANNHAIEEVIRHGNACMGKPELLKHDFARYLLRRITDEHRIVYKLAQGEVRIASCRYHPTGASPR